MSNATTSPPISPSALLDVERVPYTTSYAGLMRTVRDAGLLRRRLDFYGYMSVGLGLAVVGLLVGFLLLGSSWFQLIIAASLAIVLTQFGFLGHEASHRAVFSSGPRNDRLGRVVITLMLGVSYSWWVNKHNRHHGSPNVLGKDPDIDTDTISFHEADAARRSGFASLITRHQGWLFFPLLLLEGLNLHVKSFRWLFSARQIKGRAFELSVLAVRWTLYLGLIFSTLHLGLAFAFLGVQLGIFGLYLGASFAPNHKGMPLIPKGARVDFLSKQVLTSRNISGSFASALMGGLNFQIEHHLFPSMPRPALRHVREIVMEHCAAQGIPYTETTLAKSYGIVVRYLNRVGLAARDPWLCPQAAAWGR